MFCSAQKEVIRMLKHYVEFMYPGILFSETSETPVKRRDSALVKKPNMSYGFRFFDREETKKNGEILIGRNKNYSSVYFFGGEVYTLARVKAELPNKDILISNMESNGYKRVVKTRFGQFLPLEKRDRVL